MRRGYAGPPGAQVHYRRAGSGRPLVLFAPTPRSSRYFAALVPELAGFDVIAVDTPGFGLSDPLRGDWRMPELADRIAAALAELVPTPYAVLGVHGGNKIAAVLASRHPDRVSRLVFAGMTHSIVLADEDRIAAMRAFYTSPDVLAGDQDPADRVAQRWSQVGERIAGIWAKRGPYARDHVLDEIDGLDAFDRLYAANFALGLEEVLRGMPVPTVVVEMVVEGEAHLGRQGPLLEAAIPRAKALTVPGTDRELVTERAAELAETVRTALALEV